MAARAFNIEWATRCLLSDCIDETVARRPQAERERASMVQGTSRVRSMPDNRVYRVDLQECGRVDPLVVLL